MRRYRPPQRYVRADEVKFRDRLPTHGQNIAYRRNGHKSYCVGRFDAEMNSIRPEMNDGTCGDPIGLRWLMGWVPLSDNS